ncbi:MAG: molybdopterin molybdotransferase MoeA [Clostridiales bacterium]|jgi:molybdopterin molybdotransferase|nr:molybdopterin molybdotransferase MoeA [Clostridiales bacterium]
MLQNIPFEQACRVLLDRCGVMPLETVPLTRAHGRVLAADLVAEVSVPAFDRSPYDGYAFIAADAVSAGKDNPVSLRVIGEAAAGCVPEYRVSSGEAYKIFTGALVPEGADAIVKYEDTDAGPSAGAAGSIVRLFTPALRPDIIRAGEDVKEGDLVAPAGASIDAALAASLAAQGFDRVRVYKRPVVGILSTGAELAEPGDAPENGKIIDTNRYSLEGVCLAAGAETVWLGVVGDDAEEIAARLRLLDACDMIFLTGGVAGSEHDLTQRALKLLGAEILVERVQLKPGGACVYAAMDGKLICGFSGSPAAAMVNYFAVVRPVLRKLCGLKEYMNTEIQAALSEDYPKKSAGTRIIRGRLDLSDGTVRIKTERRLRTERRPRADDQGNTVLRSLIGCDVAAIIPKGSPSLPRGTVLKAFWLN